jgi:catechol 2,3-dioxygenase-like lactoylglutathione lyase family enzyme
MPPIKLDHCVIHITDWERSNAFYRDVLGAELVRVGTGWSYRFGETQLTHYSAHHSVHLLPFQLASLPLRPDGCHY